MRIYLLALLFLGCSSSRQPPITAGPDEENGSEGSLSGTAGTSEGCDSIPDEPEVAPTGAMGAFSESPCSEGEVGDRRDAEPSEQAEYCICESEGSAASTVWQCYGPDPSNPPVRADTTCDGGTGTGAADDSGCLISWECTDGHTYGLVCFGQGCFCQIDGQTRQSIPRVEDGLSECTGDRAIVNAYCFFWTSP